MINIEVNRQLASTEGNLLRLAENSGVKRKDFIKSWVGNEINHNWAINPGKSKSWEKFTENHNDEIISICDKVFDFVNNKVYQFKNLKNLFKSM